MWYSQMLTNWNAALAHIITFPVQRTFLYNIYILGSHGSSSIYEVISTLTYTRYALKQIPLGRGSVGRRVPDEVEQELDIVKKLKHRHIV